MPRVITFAFRNEVVRNTRSGYQDKRVTLYRITRNDIKEVASEVYNFKDDKQAAVELAAERKLFKPGPRHPSGGHTYEYDKGFTYTGNARFKQI